MGVQWETNKKNKNAKIKLKKKKKVHKLSFDYSKNMKN